MDTIHSETTMRHATVRSLAVAAAAILLAACGDVAPPSAPRAARQHPHLDLSGATGSGLNGSGDFYVSPWGANVWVAGAFLHFPSNSVCDPNASGYTYGPGSWDAPCTPLHTTVRFHAEVVQQNGHPVITFTPSIRFVPGSDVSRWVVLALPAGSAVPNSVRILYVPDAGGMVDESQGDQTIFTWLESLGFAASHIKHFSGYAVVVGDECDTACPPPCDTACGDQEGG